MSAGAAPREGRDERSQRALERLRAEVGDDALAAEPLDVAGVQLPWRFRPRDADELAAGLAALSGAAAPVVLRGGGSRIGLGRPPEDALGWLCTGALAGIEELDAEDGVVRVAAGTPVRQLADAAAGANWELPLDPAGAGATVGGVIASAADGPRLPGFGPVRDAVLGLDVTLSGGERTRCGGRVVKNVTGFDLAKLYTGSLGTLGVIDAAWLRLRARPAAVALHAVRLERPGDALFGDALALARLATARMASLLDPVAAASVGLADASSEDAWWMLLELAGEEPAVRRDGERIAERHATAAAPEDAVERVRERRAGAPGDVVRARAGVRPSRLGPLCRALAEAGFELVVQPDLGLVDATLRLAPEGDAAGALARLREQAESAGGHAVVESAPASLAVGLDPFALPPGWTALMAALKRRFDPAAILNPGRFGEGL